MNVDLPYTSVEECIAGGIAKSLTEPDRAPFKCADIGCTNLAPVAWIWQSTIFVFEAGRMLARPATMWFPLCKLHAPLQEVPELEEATDVPTAPRIS